MSEAPPDGARVSYRQQYRRCGKPACLRCAAGGPGHGPYWYAYWHTGGRTHSRYLGKQDPTEAPPAAPAAVDQPAGSGLRVRTLGGFAIWRGGVPLAVERWERRQSGALLKWLLGTAGYRLTRDEVVERFWPEGEPERGMANLRVLVHRLRRALDGGAGAPSYLRYDGEVLALAPDGGAWLDAETFALAARAALAGRDAGACRAALALYAGDYLPGDVYAEWALGRREQLRGQRLALLLHLAGLAAESGEVEEAEGSLRGVLALDRCHEPAALALMRLCAGAGRPGQALRVYRRLAEALREDLDLEPAEEIQALARALVVQRPAAPVPAAPDAVPNNLPAPLTSFVGRRRELAALRHFLQPAPGDEQAVPCRLLTLTGPGGAGKTRMALRLADDLLDGPGTYPDGVWLVELASLADPALVSKAVALTLGIQEEEARPLADTLAARLKSKRLLLLLDNCEHLLDACAALVGMLLPGCPGLQVLATSRAPLGVPGEQPWPVPALSLPAAGEAGAAGQLLDYEAVRLFLERARVQRPSLSVTEANAAAVVRICRQLDGIPLAIELAAARVSVLGLEQIAERLGESVRLLTGGPRTAPRRQQTLRATLDWSYHLLDERERMLLRRLAVFAGGCALEAAEAVCGDAGLAAEEVLDLLAGLMRQSLVQVHEAAGAARYLLLETVRQYAWTQLAACGEVAALEQRHAAYYLGLAEEAEPALTGASQAEWLARLETEHDNLRAVLRRARQRGERQLALRLAVAVWRFWYVRGHISEARRWLEELLAQAGTREQSPEQSAVRAKALNGAGSLVFTQGDYTKAEAYYEESLALRRMLDDKQGIAIVLNNLGDIGYVQDDYARAEANYEESLALGRALNDTRAIAVSLYNLGDLAWARGDYARAWVYHEESLVLRRTLGDKAGIAISLANLGSVARELGDTARAMALQEESLALKRELGDKRGIAYSLQNLGTAAFDLADYARARAQFEESLALFRGLGDKQGIANALYSLGSVDRELGDHARAGLRFAESMALYQELGDKQDIAKGLEGMARLATAPGATPAMQVRSVRLLGAAAALREAIDNPLPPSERAGYERAVAAIRAALDEAAWAAAWAEGQALTPEQAGALVSRYAWNVG